jgi:hypothetical protein
MHHQMFFLVVILALIIVSNGDPFSLTMAPISLTLFPNELQGVVISGEVTTVNIVSLNNETFQVNYYAGSINNIPSCVNISCEYNGFVEYIAIMNLSAENNTIVISGFIYDMNSLIMAIAFPTGFGIMALITLIIYLPTCIKKHRPLRY